eukprot:Sspe_Gene.45018::Locus_22168_Transcript_1_3_Confidence_0.333_Length_1104::g.45018::m.45018
MEKPVLIQAYHIECPFTLLPVCTCRRALRQGGQFPEAREVEIEAAFIYSKYVEGRCTVGNGRLPLVTRPTEHPEEAVKATCPYNALLEDALEMVQDLPVPILPDDALKEEPV